MSLSPIIEEPTGYSSDCYDYDVSVQHPYNDAGAEPDNYFMSSTICNIDYYTTPAGDTVCGGLGGQNEPLFSYKVLPVDGYRNSVDNYTTHLENATADINTTPTLNQVVLHFQ